MRRAQLVSLIISGALVALGAVVLIALQRESSTGWFAYQPMSGSVFAPGALVVLTPITVFGVVAVVTGLIGLAATAGFALGRRTRR